MQVHTGFLGAYNSVREAVVEVLDDIVEGETQPWSLWITGHSLGGALATLAAHELAVRMCVTGGRNQCGPLGLTHWQSNAGFPWTKFW